MRRLRALVQGLPPRSALHRAVAGKAADWGDAEELAATAIEVAHATLRVLVVAFGKKGASAPEPISIPRPWTVEDQPQKVTRHDFRRVLLGG